MQLNNTDFPEIDDFMNSPNAHWLPRAGWIFIYKKYMNSVYKLPLAFDMSINFDEASKRDGTKTANDLKSSVFLSKLATGLGFLDENDKWLKEDAAIDQIKKVIITFDDHYSVEYLPFNKATGTKESFYIPPLTLDYTAAATSIQADHALLEHAKAAMILVQMAKEAGWKEVNFNGTQDPLDRYYLYLACKTFGVDCSSEDVDPAAIPVNKAYTKSMEDEAYRVFNFGCEDIMRRAIIPEQKKQEKTTTPNYDDVANDFDEMNIPKFAA